MKTEIEAKWLDIDHDEFRRRLKKLGARRVRPLTQMVRAVFDDKNKHLNKKSGWIRVRDEGDKITMSYKQVNDKSLTGTKEICLTIDSFDSAVDFLKNIGFVQKSFQETRRESWELDGAEIELDEWPWLPTFVEIETKSQVKMAKIADKLGLNLSDAMHGSADFVYERYYDVTCDEVNSWPEIKFSETPKWLADRKRKVYKLTEGGYGV
jgi:adenylate cyclase class 2